MAALALAALSLLASGGVRAGDVCRLTRAHLSGSLAVPIIPYPYPVRSAHAHARSRDRPLVVSQLYKQCDQQWANNTMGGTDECNACNDRSATICDQGGQAFRAWHG
jgi:hypothetical protein